MKTIITSEGKINVTEEEFHEKWMEWACGNESYSYDKEKDELALKTPNQTSTGGE